MAPGAAMEVAGIGLRFAVLEAQLEATFEVEADDTIATSSDLAVGKTTVGVDRIAVIAGFVVGIIGLEVAPKNTVATAG